MPIEGERPGQPLQLGRRYRFPHQGGAALAITASEASKKRGSAVLMSREDHDALREAAYLLRVPANARRLLDSLEQARQGQPEEHELPAS